MLEDERADWPRVAVTVITADPRWPSELRIADRVQHGATARSDRLSPAVGDAPGHGPASLGSLVRLHVVGAVSPSTSACLGQWRTRPHRIQIPFWELSDLVLDLFSNSE